MSETPSNDLPFSEHMLLGFANAVTTTVIRILHAMVPVIDHLEQSGAAMSRLVEAEVFNDAPGGAILEAKLTKWSNDAWYLSNLMHEQARLVGYPIEDTLSQFRATEATVTTLEMMREELARLDAETLTELSARLTRSAGNDEPSPA